MPGLRFYIFFYGSICQHALTLVTHAFLFALLSRTRRDYKTLGFGFIAVLAVADFLYAFHRIPLALFDVGAIDGDELVWLGDGFFAWFCPLTNTLTVLCPFLAALSATLLSVERYCQVCLKRPLSPRIGWLLFVGIALPYLIPTTVAAVAIVKNLPKLVPEDPVCFPPLEPWRNFRNHLQYISLSVFLCVLTFCYINIFLTTKRSVMQTHSSSVTRRVAIRVFVFLGLYLFCYFPVVVTYIRMANKIKPIQVIEFMNFILNGFISLTDPILVLFLHRKYHDEFLLMTSKWQIVRFLKRSRCRKPEQ